MNVAETYILFDLANTAYGVRSKDVLHVEMLEHITPVPSSIRAVDGVVFSRGQVIPALNLRVRFGLPPQPVTARTRLIFLRHEQRTVALIVDSAREFRTIPSDAVRPLAGTLAAVNGNYVSGVATLNNRLVLLLDVAAVLNLGDIDSMAAAAAFQPTA